MTPAQYAEQRDRACANLQDAAAVYERAAKGYRTRKDAANLRKLKDAYSKLSAAHWEVEQYEPITPRGEG